MRMELIAFFLALAVFLFLKFRKKDNSEQEQKTIRKKMSVNWIWIVVIVILLIGSWWGYKYCKSSADSQLQTTTEIYPNYTFENGENQISVPLIPSNQRLSRESGGWVMVPVGARAHVDHKVPIIVENIDGHRSPWIKPRDASWFGVDPGNGMVRYYGSEGESATISIKRNFYK